MAKTYDQEEFWALLRYAVSLEHRTLREADMALVVREIHGNPTVVGLVVAEDGEDIDALERSFPSL
jgi:hypothetical protein